MYSAISSDALSNRSGGTEGRPTELYIWSKIGDRFLSTLSVTCLTRRTGCSCGIRCSTSITINIDRCCRSSPRIRHFLRRHCAKLGNLTISQIRQGFFDSLLELRTRSSDLLSPA